MKVLLYLEGKAVLEKSGIGRALQHQMKALDLAGIPYTTDSSGDYDVVHINTYGPRSLRLLHKAKKQGKKVIAVPRLASYGEHVDDHQVQLLREFDGMNLICACYDSEKLGDCIRDTGSRDFAGYHSNTRRILKDIENFLIAEEGENHGKHSKIS